MRRMPIFLLSLLWLSAAPSISDDPHPAEEKKYLAVLKEICTEVKEMGLYPGQAFVQQAFFVGVDDDDTNKDIHVSILIRAQKEMEKMTVRVTSMKKDRRNPQARLAGKTKEFICLIGEDEVKIRSSDYPEKEIAQLAPEILTAVRNKKRLLKLITEYRVPFF